LPLDGPPETELHVFRLEDRKIDENQTKLTLACDDALAIGCLPFAAQTADSTPQVDQQTSPSQTSGQQNSTISDATDHSVDYPPVTGCVPN